MPNPDTAGAIPGRTGPPWAVEGTVYFYGGWLSNFARTPGLRLPFGYDGHDENDHVPVSTVEHWFQACKATSRGQFDMILACGSAAAAKRAGRETELRPDWVSRPGRPMTSHAGCSRTPTNSIRASFAIGGSPPRHGSRSPASSSRMSTGSSGRSRCSSCRPCAAKAGGSPGALAGRDPAVRLARVPGSAGANSGAPREHRWDPLRLCAALIKATVERFDGGLARDVADRHLGSLGTSAT